MERNGRKQGSSIELLLRNFKFFVFCVRIIRNKFMKRFVEVFRISRQSFLWKLFPLPCFANKIFKAAIVYWGRTKRRTEVSAHILLERKGFEVLMQSSCFLRTRKVWHCIRVQHKYEKSNARDACSGCNAGPSGLHFSLDCREFPYCSNYWIIWFHTGIFLIEKFHFRYTPMNAIFNSTPLQMCVKPMKAQCAWEGVGLAFS